MQLPRAPAQYSRSSFLKGNSNYSEKTIWIGKTPLRVAQFKPMAGFTRGERLVPCLSNPPRGRNSYARPLDAKRRPRLWQGCGKATSVSLERYIHDLPTFPMRGRSIDAHRAPYLGPPQMRSDKNKSSSAPVTFTA